MNDHCTSTLTNHFFVLFQESIVFLLEQLPGAHQLKHYNFKYNPPFEVSESKTKASFTAINF